MTPVLASFPAPWSRSLRLTSGGSVVVLLVMVLTGLFTGPRHFLVWRLAMVGLPLILLLRALPFMVRG